MIQPTGALQISSYAPDEQPLENFGCDYAGVHGFASWTRGPTHPSHNIARKVAYAERV